MAYLIGEKLAMLHIPKTGGIFLKELLGGKPFAKQHTIAKCPPGRKMFVIIRDPAYWLRSFWGHMQRHGPSANGPRFRGLEFEPIEVDCWKRDIPINDFYAAYLKKHPGLISSAFSKYIAEVDDVIKNETLRISTIILLDKHGELTPALSHNLVQSKRRNETPHDIRDFNEPSEAMKAAVRKAEGEFCARWNYSGAAPE